MLPQQCIVYYKFLVGVSMNKTSLYCVVLLGMLLGGNCLYAKPLNIKPNLSYYSADYSLSGNQYELAEEKNLEEVFKNYNYYEAIYDELERVKIFRAYKRGEVDFSEVYFYNSAGGLARKITIDSSGKKHVMEFGL